ncbi:hypothetical protein FY034_04545 [Trichlorobacter lovleyi]|uniref:hypothetical protein n=1 Tax=Trichlorobacter lovleyi TaxID=313985 RepID=UPI002240BBD6|nr:hypothetical protein [Trichlorobacter lovleyi]QOX78234.1 hypothetical protein FY034_04545 [Trichlorobacter lovleyi]
MKDTITSGPEEDFENEASLMELHTQVMDYLYKWKDFMAVARIIRPDLCANVFERRPCRRKLEYIGDHHNFFVKDNIYKSTTFNGATYTFEGYERATGYTHFRHIS